MTKQVGDTTTVVSATFAPADNIASGPASIAEMARALKFNPDLIYQHVRNNVDYIPTYGVQKGAFGALIDGAGNSFDQSMLMVELLRESGFTANYVLGVIKLNATQAANFLGVSTTDGLTVEELLANGGIPCTVTLNGDGSLDEVEFGHMWVQANIGGTFYAFDPSFKTYTYKTGINIGTTIGYDRATFLSAAETGATITADSVEDMNTSNIHASLIDFAGDLITWIKSNQPGATLSDIVGGKSINQSFDRVRQTSLPYEAPGYPAWDIFTEVGGDIPWYYRVTLDIAMPGISAFAFSDEVYGHRLTVFYDSSLRPNLIYDGLLIDTGDPVVPGFFHNTTVEVTHWAYPTTFADRLVTLPVYSVDPYMIALGFSSSSRSMMEYHRLLEREFVASGASSVSEPVFGELFAMQWYAHDAQDGIQTRLLSQMNKCVTTFHHVIATTGYIGTPYYDIHTASSYSSKDLSDSSINIGSLKMAASLHSSGLEAAVLQQLHQVNSVCNPKVLDAANSGSLTIFSATSSNWTSIEPQLTNYPAPLKTLIGNLVSSGHQVILPIDGEVTIDSWSSAALLAIKDNDIQTLISAVPFSGGQGADPCDLEDDNEEPEEEDPDDDCPCRCSSPVDIFYGNLMLHRGEHLSADLTIGKGSFPYELSFERMYHSSMRFMNHGLGWGWMHNYAWSVRPDSDGFQAMGEDSPIDAAGSIVEMFVSLDLLNDSSVSLSRFTSASLAASWWIGQISQNTLALSMPGSNNVFVRLPDGSFNPAPAEPGTIAVTGTGYTFTTPQQIVYTFNSDGQCTHWQHPSGASVTLTYSSGKLTSISNNMGRTLTLTYTGDNLTSVSDGTGRSVSYDFDREGNLISVIDAAGKESTFWYGTRGLLGEMYLPANPTVPHLVAFYDSLGRVAVLLDANENRSAYLLAGPRAEKIDALGNSHVRYMDARGHTLKMIDPLQRAITYQLDGRSYLIKQTFPEGDSIEFTWDENENLLSREFVPKPGSPLAPITNSFTYDPAFNKVATATDGKGQVTSFGYDATTGNLLSIERPEVGGQTPTVTFTYNGKGQVLTRTDETGIVTEFSYNATTEALESVVVDKGVGRLNLTTQFGRNSVGDVTSVTDPRGNTVSFQVDALRRTTQRTEPSPFNFVTKFNFDDNSNLLSIERQTGDAANPWQTQSFLYSLTDMLVQSIDPSGNQTIFEYDAKDRLAAVTDAENRRYQLILDPNDRLSKLIGPAGEVLETRLYTPNGLLSALIDANGNKTEFTFDGFDRLDKKIYADGSFEQNVLYDANNNILTFRTSSGNTITRTFDELDRVVTRSPQGQTTVTMTYDLADRLLTASKPVVSGDPSTGTIELNYDSAGRFISEEQPHGKLVAHQLDANGNVTRTTWPDSFFVDYAFDEMNRLSQVKLNGSLDTSVHYDYDQLSRRTGMAYSNGVRSKIEFEPNDFVSAITHNLPPAKPLKYTYTRNKLGEVIAQHVSDPTLLAPAGLEQSRHYVTNNLNQYTQVGTDTLQHDGNGNLIEFGNQSHSFNTENQLLTSAVGGDSTNFSYDALGRRVLEQDSGQPAHRILFSGVVPIAEYRQDTDVLLQRFVFGDSLLLPIAQVAEPAAAISFMHRDQLGSVVAVSNGSNATLQSELAYLPFGQVSPGAGDAADKFGFAGMYHHARSGLNLTLFRAYDSRLGRWLSRDPLGESAGSNLYAYVDNDPINTSDPLGLYGINVDFPGHMVTVPPEYRINGQPKQLPLGHSAVIAVDEKTGLTKYFEYGRYESDFGQVHNPKIPDLVVKNGAPTPESLQNLKNWLSKHFEHGGPVNFALHPDSDFKKIVDFATKRKNDPNRKPYDWNPFKANTCKTFAQEAIDAGKKK